MSRSTNTPNEPIRDPNYRMAFGKHRGETLGDLMKNVPDYLLWLHEHTEFELHADLVEKLEAMHRPIDWYDVYQLQDKGIIPK